jgi:predicted DNA binding protein
MLEAVLEVSVPADWKQTAIQMYGAQIELLKCLSGGRDGCRNLVRITVDPSHLEDVVRLARADRGVTTVDLREVARGTLKGVLGSRDCIDCLRIVERDAFIVEARMEKPGRMVQRIVASDRDAVRRIIKRLEARGHDVELQKLSSVDADELLTGRQEELVALAWEHGYFDRPRKTSLRDMSRELGVSISTISEILRKAQWKIMSERFGAAET